MRQRGIFFKAAAIIGAVCIAEGVLAQSGTGPQAGQELSASLRAMRPDHAVEWTGTLQIFGRGHKVAPVPISFQSSLTGSNWSFTYQTQATDAQGAEKLTIVFSTNSPNQYFYAQSPSPGAPLGELKQLTGAQADIPLAGSDFWLSDLGFEFYHWPDQNRLKGEQTRGQPCYVIESRNPSPLTNGYVRVRTWVDEKTDGPLQAYGYAADKSVIKDFEMGSVERVNGHYEVKELKMFNRKTGSRTYLDFDLKDK